MTEYNDAFMTAALGEAKQALMDGEVPVGCVFVQHGRIVAAGHNRTNERHNAVEHAELVALADADAAGDVPYDLAEVDLYVTVEPCIMCASALLYRGVRRVFFGCPNTHFGGNGSILAIHSDGCMSGAHYASEGGKRAADAIALLQQFYRQENPQAPAEKRCRKEVPAAGDG
jgi:tRNA-specific adenosine deaminase 2